jgi:NAD(P)-dependent dehydrogenase (short-subunit alcohol dehydrogenase family)
MKLAGLLDGRVALITGDGSEIGTAIAQADGRCPARG